LIKNKYILILLIIIIDLFLIDSEINIIPEKMESLLEIFIIVPATILALLFPIFFRDQKEGVIYPRSDTRYVIIYIYLYIIGISLSLFTLIGLFNLTNIIFKINLLFFLNNLLFIPPYLFVVIKRDVVEVIEKIKNSILRDLNPSILMKNQKIDCISFKINELQRIILQALDDHNYSAVEEGINALKNIYIKINKKNKIQFSLWKKIYKFLFRYNFSEHAKVSYSNKILKVLLELGIKCIEKRHVDFSKKIVNIYREISVSKNFIIKDFHFILYLRILGMKAIKNINEEPTDTIINTLAQIGDQYTINRSYLSIPIILKVLQDIAIACSEKKMIHQCQIARTRIIQIARQGNEEIKKEALRRFWVITAYLYVYNNEMEETQYFLETQYRNEFRNEFISAANKAIELLHNEGEWTQKRIVKNFITTSQFFQESKEN
jgi:hypothetical protein